MLAAGLQIFPGSSKEDPQSRIRNAEQMISALRETMLNDIGKIGHSDPKEWNKYGAESESHKKGITLYVIEKDTLRYWSDNEPAIKDSILLGTGSGELLHLPNGDFLA